ncbi:TBC domain containing protein, partial [Entamoeba invadens IP1]|uniref:TBC domain containing protein n=1 Tax=Entamoeba invadens IP1 TaxID=370355 RepID=UPI0002C3F917
VNGFIYFEYIPLIAEPIFEFMSRKSQSNVIDVNNFQTEFSFREVVSVKSKRVRPALMGNTYELVSFEFDNALPFVVPSYEFKTRDEVESLIGWIKKKGGKVTVEDNEHEECIYRIDARMANTESFQQRMNRVSMMCIKATNDPVKQVSRKQWVKSNGVFEMNSSFENLTGKRREEIRRIVKYKGLSKGKSRVFGWMVCGGEILESEKKELRYDMEIARWSERFRALKSQWSLFLPEQLERWKSVRDVQTQIQKDLSRTLIEQDKVGLLQDILQNYALFDMEVNYMQGMNEIASICIKEGNTEIESFILFTMAMKMVREFYAEASVKNLCQKVAIIVKVVDKELYEWMTKNEIDFMFCWRSIALLFKREFKKEDVLRIWDFLISYIEDKMYLFLMVAVLVINREFILSVDSFDDLLQFMTMIQNQDVEIIWDADMLFNQFIRTATTKDKNIVFH